MPNSERFFCRPHLINHMFKHFAKAFPVDAIGHAAVNSSVVSDFVQTELGVKVPVEIRKFWNEQGSGYFGERALYFFGDGSKEQPRDSLMSWNGKDFWREIYPSPREGGPVFFAETCFGDQLGFRWEDNQCLYILFCIDTFDAFLISRDGAELFNTILADRMSLLDEARYKSVCGHFGSLPLGMHYAPIVSPMVYGTGELENLCLETPNVHFRTALATFKACQSS